jgi:DNA-binding response OmpR family regulator
VVLLTSLTDATVRRRALELGACDYVVKPLNFSGYCVHMEALVERWLGRAEPPAAPVHG